MKGVDDFNQRTRQGQAAVERKFVEGRLTVARAALREAEDRLGYFLRANRQIDNSPELVVNRDRMQRDLMLTQQVYTTLAQSYEEVRIREVRDTPVITVLEPPFVPTLPQPRGRVAGVLFGLMLGAFFGVVLSFSAEMLARRRQQGSVEANDLAEMLEGMKGGALKRIRQLSLRT